MSTHPLNSLWFQAFRLRLILELRHEECSMWLTHGSVPLMVFGSLAPLWCCCIGPLRACASSAFVLCIADGSCASVLAEQALCVGHAIFSGIGPVRAHLPSGGRWLLCIGLCRANILCWPFEPTVYFGIGHSRGCVSGTFALWMGKMEVVHWFLPSKHILCWSSGRTAFMASVVPEHA